MIMYSEKSKPPAKLLNPVTGPVGCLWLEGQITQLRPVEQATVGRQRPGLNTRERDKHCIKDLEF